MSRRKENVRRACNWIDATIDTAIKNTDNLSSLERVRMMNALLNSIKTYTHRIKRTTWRGEKSKGILIGDRIYFSSEDGLKKLAAIPTKPIAKKDKWNKDWDKYNNAKRINTNQTTTANIDVSTIPYY